MPSEAIHIGKRLLVKAVKGQYEQMSNAKAMTLLDIGSTMDEVNSGEIGQWLNNYIADLATADHTYQSVYPNVAEKIAKWVCAGDLDSVDDLRASLW